MAEIGGPTAQAGIRYQDRVAALYLGRMMDPRERPSRDRPVEVRVETPDDVDDFLVRFDDGSRRYFQVKLALQRRGEAWTSLWSSLYRQLGNGLSLDDRLVLVIGEPSALASDLRNLAARTDGTDVKEWSRRLTARQKTILSSISDIIHASFADVLGIFRRLDVNVWPSQELERDYVPLWVPAANVPRSRLFEVLAGITWAGAETRSRFEGAVLRDTLNEQWDIFIGDAPSWGMAGYRSAVASMASIEVPGTGFRQTQDTEFLWPRCLRYDHGSTADFDDDLPGWRELGASKEVDLRKFPGPDLNAVVLVAGPGFGKSTVVKAVARRVSLDGFVPAIIPVTKLSDSDLTIAEYLEHVVNREFDVRIDWRAAGATGALVLLVDGLDEVSDDRRTVVLERFNVYRAAHPGVRWMMTVRDAAALAAPEGAEILELAPLRSIDVYMYVDFYRPGEPGIAEKLLERIASRTDLAHLARIPIFLSLMLVLRLENADLRRSDLLDTYIETLFQPNIFKSTENDVADTASLRRIAERAAFEALEADSIGITKHLFARSVNESGHTVSVDDAREALIRRGVLRRSGLLRLSFPFPIVQEYLASAELLKQTTDGLVSRLGMIFRRPWAQAIQFALERHADPGPIINQILDDEDDVFYTGLRLLGRCLANGMAVTASQHEEIGRRLAIIWGGCSWRANRLINSIIVDAFSKPLHSSVRSRLGERELIHNGAGAIVALNQDTELTISVIDELLTGDIEHLLNIGELQDEVNRVGTRVFELYIERCRRDSECEKVNNTISCLIGHMSIGSIDVDVAYAAAFDEVLAPQVRLAAWSKSKRTMDSTIERLILQCVNAEGYHPNASAAQALSSPVLDVITVARIIGSPEISSSKATNILDYLISDWRDLNCSSRVQELLDVAEISEPFFSLLKLYSIESGNLEALDWLIDRIGELSIEITTNAIMLLGHVLDREMVELIVAKISARSWSAADRVSLAGAFVTGLSYRMQMMGLQFGSLEPLPFHPGRNVPLEMLKIWLEYDDYSPVERLQIVFDAVILGVAHAEEELRSSLNAVLVDDLDDADASLAGRVIEQLQENGEGLSSTELEDLAKNGPYNLASSAIALISKGGARAEVNTLMRLYSEVDCEMLKSLVLEYLEPLASRLALRITRNRDRLSASLA